MAEIINESQNMQENVENGAEENAKNEQPAENNNSKVSEISKEDILKELGFDDEESAKEAAKKIKEEAEKKMTAAEKENRKFLEEKKARIEAEKKMVEAEAKVEALMVGSKPECVDDVICLAVYRVSKEKGMQLKDAISEIKKLYPDMFNGKDENDKDKKGQKGTGGVLKNNNSGNNTETSGSFGRRLAEQNAQSKKSSFFTK